jgi:hypothetical protein
MRAAGTADRSSVPCYRVPQLSYDSRDDLQAGIATDGGRATLAELGNVATGGVAVLRVEGRLLDRHDQLRSGAARRRTPMVVIVSVAAPVHDPCRFRSGPSRSGSRIALIMAVPYETPRPGVPAADPAPSRSGAPSGGRADADARIGREAVTG